MNSISQLSGFNFDIIHVDVVLLSKYHCNKKHIDY